MDSMIKYAFICLSWFVKGILSNQLKFELEDDPELYTDSMPGPDDLVTVDYVIIGVTCLVVGGILIGGTIFACMKKKDYDREKEAMYNKYLTKDEFAGVGTGVDNHSYDDRL